MAMKGSPAFRPGSMLVGEQRIASAALASSRREHQRRVPPPQNSTLKFMTVELEHGLFVRVMERPGRVQGEV